MPYYTLHIKSFFNKNLHVEQFKDLHVKHINKNLHVEQFKDYMASRAIQRRFILFKTPR